MRLLFFLLALMACDEATTAVAERCDIALSALSPAEGEPGTAVSATVSPVTQTWDTVVHVGNAEAPVEAVMRTDCEECSSCRSTERCDSCEACEACDDVCRDTCIESVQFTVPALSPGAYAASVINKHGHSNNLMFTVLSAPDTGDSDTGDESSP